MSDVLRYSSSVVTQGKFRFYSLTLPSDVLAATCFVASRDEDPEIGFQRELDKTRAKEIAKYIDDGIGPIPGSIVLSARPEARLREVARGKTIEFRRTPRAFLILDGQHRVYGFRLAKTPTRVPVVIFDGLDIRAESRLFIDINSKQRPVPTALLLDIKKLADYETSVESTLGSVFGLFNNTPNSPLLGLMSASKHLHGKISRVTFYAAVRPLLPIFGTSNEVKIYEILSEYVQAVSNLFEDINVKSSMTSPIVFRAIMQLFREVAERVKDRYQAEYNAERFYEVLRPLKKSSISARIKNPGAAYQKLYVLLAKTLKKSFTI